MSSGPPSGPPVWDRLEILCVWVPEGGEIPPVPWPNAAAFPAIWLPDDRRGPRPGYPWIEFGRMALPCKVETAPAPAGRAVMPPGIGLTADTVPAPGLPVAMPPGEPTGRAPQAVSGRLTAGPVAPGLEATANGSRTGYAYHPDIGAAMEAWNAFSDLRSTVAALKSDDVS